MTDVSSLSRTLATTNLVRVKLHNLKINNKTVNITRKSNGGGGGGSNGDDDNNNDNGDDDDDDDDEYSAPTLTPLWFLSYK